MNEIKDNRAIEYKNYKPKRWPEVVRIKGEIAHIEDGIYCEGVEHKE